MHGISNCYKGLPSKGGLFMQDFISRTIVDRPVLSKYSFGNWFNMVNYITLFTL